jgi:alkanesulfonate monooxygenase SsuD/methylene tetrahydromethanopterin reductase-like flavin-dependent oxidoreductase (luciferase family)
MDIGIVCFPYSVDEIVRVARAADRAESDLLVGFPDSPLLFTDTYLAQQAVLEATERIHVGPFSTNPVTRHYSVHAAMHRALNERHPGRSFLAIGPGDSAVHSFGLPPATPDLVRAHVQGVRDHGPEELRIIVAAGGLKAAAGAGLASDEVVFGQGFDRGSTESLTQAAITARRAAGIDRSLKRWLYVLADVWAAGDGADDPDARETFQSMIMAYSRQAMSATYSGKNVPPNLQPRLRELYSEFSFESYGGPGNARLLQRFQDEEQFLRRRFAVSGTPDAVAAQIRAGVEESNADGVWIGLLGPHARTMVELFVKHTMPLL